MFLTVCEFHIDCDRLRNDDASSHGNNPRGEVDLLQYSFY
mgnify:CR=1 FL=1